MLFASLYVGFRFSWQAFDHDEARLTRFSESISNQGTITRSTDAYIFGYQYPSFNNFLSKFTGLDISTIQLYLQPLLITLLVPVAYAAFSGLVGKRSVAALAVLLLFLQAEFLFESLRSSHAKVTWLMALLLLYLLTASFKVGNKGLILTKWVGLFYLAAYAMIASNSFFSSNYIFALTFAFLVGILITLWLKEPLAGNKRLTRLILVSISCSILVFLFIFFLYPPSLDIFRFLKYEQERFAALFLDFEVATNPYAYVRSTWVNDGVYLALTAFSWSILAISFLVWVRMAYNMIRSREHPTTQLFLLWLLYAAFAFLLILSVFLDLSGVLSTNLQVRLFPNLMIFAIPLASLGIANFYSWSLRRSRIVFRLVLAIIIIFLLYFPITSLLKVTNEPLLSNQWSFFSFQERTIMDWIPDHIRNTNIWVGNNGRLTIFSYLSKNFWYEQGVYAFFSSPALPNAQYYLETEISSQQAARMNLPMPDLRRKIKVYDNGQASLYKFIPQTPYQK